MTDKLKHVVLALALILTAGSVLEHHRAEHAHHKHSHVHERLI